MSTPPTPQHDAGAQPVPTCYRHPDRETYVRCVRCDRSVCPDCMREASVGFQCVDCVREGNRGMREARSVYGGRTVATPYVVYVLLGLNLAMYVGELANGALAFALGLIPQGVAEGGWYRLISSMFVHDPRSFLHILFNMWALWVLGPQLERLLGHGRFTALYMLSGLGGSVLTYLLAPLGTVTFGASGAIFGLFAGLFVIGRKQGYNVRMIGFLVVLNLVLTFVVPGISWTGHIGGLITGGLLALGYAYAPRDRQRAVHLGMTAVTLAIFVGLVLLRSTALL
ncbi:MAG: rhomboid family intramembrane serine protease [Streptosporangiales bacterium]|nr:rhomboid family intramembrane serine protease [Streptosporangiales bacterium]